MNYLHVAWMTLATFAALWAITRIMGKRQISQLTFFDYITGITIGSIAANGLEEPSRWGTQLLAMVLWAGAALGLHWVGIKFRAVHQVMDGAPSILVQNGKVLEENLGKVGMDLGSLFSLLRLQGYFDLSEIEFALMETDGRVSVLPRSQYRPVRPQDLKLPTRYEGLPTQVIHEGKPLGVHLQQLGLTEEWLRVELNRQGVTDSLDSIFAAWLNPDGTLVIDRYQDGAPQLPTPV